MSGYSSKAEALSVLKATLDNGPKGLPMGSKNYNVSAIFNEMFHNPARGEWRLTDYSEESLIASARKHLRPSGKEALRFIEHRANMKKAENLPWGDEKCRLMYGVGLETYMSM